jgi:hypothetical protein
MKVKPLYKLIECYSGRCQLQYVDSHRGKLPGLMLIARLIWTCFGIFHWRIGIIFTT